LLILSLLSQIKGSADFSKAVRKQPFRTAYLIFMFWNKYCDGEEKSVAPNVVLPQNCFNRFCLFVTVSPFDSEAMSSQWQKLLLFNPLFRRDLPETPLRGRELEYA